MNLEQRDADLLKVQLHPIYTKNYQFTNNNKFVEIPQSTHFEIQSPNKMPPDTDQR